MDEDKLLAIGLRFGRLECWDCIYCTNCEEVNAQCEANGLYDDMVVHWIDKENIKDGKQ